MIMNMYGLMEQRLNAGERLTMGDVEQSFGGNMCRCTGYRPILEAFRAFGCDATDAMRYKCQIADIEDLPAICSMRNRFKPMMKQPSSDATTRPCIVQKSDGQPVWHRVSTLPTLLAAFGRLDVAPGQYQLVAGNTARGITRTSHAIRTFIDINGIAELHTIQSTDLSLSIGALVTLTEAIRTFGQSARSMPGFAYCDLLSQHFERIANVPVRNVASVAGNLCYKHQHPEFPSDVFVTMDSIDARLIVVDEQNMRITVTMCAFLEQSLHRRVLHSIVLPRRDSAAFALRTYKITIRAQNAHAYVNAGISVRFATDTDTDHRVTAIRICYGGIAPQFRHASHTEALASETAFDLYSDNGLQVVVKYEGLQQTAGDACYIDDLPTMPGELWAAFAVADRVHCTIGRIDAADALAEYGVHFFYAAKDIPGQNNYTPFTVYTPMVEKIFLSIGDEVQFNGQPIGMVLADSFGLANRAASMVKITYIATSTLASMARMWLGPLLGRDHQTTSIRPTIRDVSFCTAHHPTATIAGKAVPICGRFEIAGQYHYTMETQSTICRPNAEHSTSLDVYCSTQWMDNTQIAIAEMLAIPQNHVHMIVPRLGGAYGAKVSRATQIGCAAALGTHLSRLPVRFIMQLEANMRTIGKRTGLVGDYTVSADPRTGRVLGCQCTYAQDAGCSLNETMIMKTTRAMANVYDTDALRWTVTGRMVQTDAPSNTFCRSPSTLEAIAMVENIMEHIADVTGVTPLAVRLANMRLDSPMRAMTAEFVEAVEFEPRRADCDRYNAANRWRKRGMALVPMRWPLDYEGVMSAYVAVFRGDGSVVVAHGGLECGQGINTKVAQVVAYVLAVPLASVRVRQTDTVLAANAFMTAISSTSEMACYAAKRACETILKRMEPVRAVMRAGYTWSELVAVCHERQIDLRSTYQFTPADLRPYDIYGIGACEVEVDVLSGMYQLRRVDIWEDVGESMSPLVDAGQVEGSFVMGIGYWCTEELVYDRKDGRLLTDRTWTYKPPGALDIPIDFRIKFVRNGPNPGSGFLRSKGSWVGEICDVIACKFSFIFAAVGEPAICLSVMVLFALCDQIGEKRCGQQCSVVSARIGDDAGAGLYALCK